MDKILNILSDPDDGRTSALPDILRRLNAIEKRLDHLQKSLTSERPVMDVPSVCRILKIRPRAAYELAENGTIPYRMEGKKTLFYADEVHRYYVKTTRGLSESTPATEEFDPDAPPKKRRGRPPGSKNKVLY